MNYVLFLVLSMTCIFATADVYAKAVSTAAEKQNSQITKQTPAVSVSLVEGKVASVDTAALLMKLITNDNKEASLLIDPAVSSVNWGYTGISFSELTPNSQVKIETFIKNGSEYIKKVEVIYLEKQATTEALPAPAKKSDKSKEGW